MKFQLAINLERHDPSTDIRDVMAHTLDIVKKADQAGFSTVWAAEHHALEMTIAPNPFQILTWWAENTERIRLGTAVAVAPYWHPIDLAGEAAFVDQLSGGRLEFGIGSGAYQREFDRMHPGLKQTDGWRYMHEMLPAVRALWQGDYEHNGEFWSFPMSTSVPKPLQQPGPPVWVAARAPITYDYAVANDCNIMSWPLTRPFDEAVLYKTRLDEAMERHPGAKRPVFAMMRHSSVYTDEDARDAALTAIQKALGRFENLFRNLGDVEDGFPKEIALEDLANRDEYNREMLETNLLFGSPDQVIEKLKQYEELGVDEFIYYSSMGLGQEYQKRSFELFCNEVMPAFAG